MGVQIEPQDFADLFRSMTLYASRKKNRALAETIANYAFFFKDGKVSIPPDSLNQFVEHAEQSLEFFAHVEPSAHRLRAEHSLQRVKDSVNAES